MHSVDKHSSEAVGGCRSNSVLSCLFICLFIAVMHAYLFNNYQISNVTAQTNNDVCVAQVITGVITIARSDVGSISPVCCYCDSSVIYLNLLSYSQNYAKAQQLCVIELGT